MPSQIIRIFVLCLSLRRPCRCIFDFAGSSLDHVSFEEAPRGSDWTQSPRYLRKVGGVGKTTGGYEGKRQKTGTLRVRNAVGWRLMDFNSELNMNWAVCFERTIGSKTLDRKHWLDAPKNSKARLSGSHRLVAVESSPECLEEDFPTPRRGPWREHLVHASWRWKATTTVVGLSGEI